MPRKTVKPGDEREDRPALEVYPPAVLEGDQIIVRGSGWEDHSIKIEIDGKAVKPFRILLGFPTNDGVLPDATGSFVVRISTLGMKSGKHRIAATLAPRTSKGRAARSFEVSQRPRFDPDGRPVDKPHFRELDFFERRFGHMGFVPPGVRRTQISEIRRLREKRDKIKRNLLQEKDLSVLLSTLVPGVCNWNPVGAAPLLKAQYPGDQAQSVSGRVLAIAIDPTSPATNRTVYIGTATAGVWKSTDNGETWSPKTDYMGSLAIGALAIDPNKPSRIFAGTGEYHGMGPGASVYYGYGLLRSEDGGESWKELATGQFERDEITRILFDPNDLSSQHMFLSSATGVYESYNGGTNWTPLVQGFPVSDLVLFYDGSPAAITLIAAVDGMGLFKWNQSIWPNWPSIKSAAFPTGPIGRIALGQSQNYPKNIYAAFSAAGGGNLAGIAKTTNGGEDWGSVDIPPQQNDYQLNYNLHISVHPTNPDIVYYGAVRLWKTITGNGPWTNIISGNPSSPPSPGTQIGIHVDQHAFAFDPADPDNVIWAGNDGGVYRSTNGGETWSHRNRDLATLQYIHVSLHPGWEAVMLGGTMDNGTLRYSGHPAWERADYGDGGSTAIDPSDPTIMYEVISFVGIRRSDDAGALGSFKPKQGNITGPSEFYPPFILDPSDPKVCYFGGNKLWRSPNKAETWDDITGPLTGNSTAIAVHPLNSGIIYVVTSQGHVYLVEKNGMTWNLTDLTGPDLPAGVHISDLAVDTMETVWVTFSSILYGESTGEFTNDHVYRRDAMTGKWESRSNGLAKANPINTIVIDPTNENRLFCGGDIGVFRTENAGGIWEPWDEGLPNAPVYHLTLHGPRRLLRAATYGRSVWERPIDTTSCKMVDLYLRDNILDTGRVQPSPSGHPHPFDPSTNVYWWESVDIKVDARKFGKFGYYQTPEPITDYVSFEGDLQHRNPRRPANNRLYIQVHNRGVSKATNVTVRVFVANTSAGYPALSNDFWSAGKPFSADPSSNEWVPVGPAKSIAVLEPAEPAVFYWPWYVSKYAAPTDTSLLALATCSEDPLVGAGIYDVAILVQNRKQAALKKVKVISIVIKGKPKKKKPKKLKHPKAKKSKPKKTRPKKRK